MQTVYNLDNKKHYIPWKCGFGFFKLNSINIMFVDVFINVVKDTRAPDVAAYATNCINAASPRVFSEYALSGKEIKDIANVS
jgi:hypothetical protein